MIKILIKIFSKKKKRKASYELLLRCPGVLCAQKHMVGQVKSSPSVIAPEMKVHIHIYALASYQVYILKSQIEYKVHFNFRECRK